MSLDKKMAEFFSSYGKGCNVIEAFPVPDSFISSRSLCTVESGVVVQDPIAVK